MNIQNSSEAFGTSSSGQASESNNETPPPSVPISAAGNEAIQNWNFGAQFAPQTFPFTGAAVHLPVHETYHTGHVFGVHASPLAPGVLPLGYQLISRNGCPDPLVPKRGTSVPYLPFQPVLVENAIIKTVETIMSPANLKKSGMIRHMNNDLWLKLNVVYGSKEFKTLGLPPGSLGFVASVIQRKLNGILHLNETNTAIRPAQYLCSSVFLTNVRPQATVSNVLALVSKDYSSSYVLPFGFLNVLRHSDTSWSVLYRKPSAAIRVSWRSGSYIRRRNVDMCVCVGLRPDTPAYRSCEVPVFEMNPAVQGPNVVMPVTTGTFLSRNANWYSNFAAGLNPPRILATEGMLVYLPLKPTKHVPEHIPGGKGLQFGVHRGNNNLETNVFDMKKQGEEEMTSYRSDPGPRNDKVCALCESVFKRGFELQVVAKLCSDSNIPGIQLE